MEQKQQEQQKLNTNAKKNVKIGRPVRQVKNIQKELEKLKRLVHQQR